MTIIINKFWWTPAWVESSSKYTISTSRSLCFLLTRTRRLLLRRLPNHFRPLRKHQNICPCVMVPSTSNTRSPCSIVHYRCPLWSSIQPTARPIISIWSHSLEHPHHHWSTQRRTVPTTTRWSQWQPMPTLFNSSQHRQPNLSESLASAPLKLMKALWSFIIHKFH